MLSALLLHAVWRGNADDLDLTFSFEGSSIHRQQFPGGVFVFAACWTRETGARKSWAEARHYTAPAARRHFARNDGWGSGSVNEGAVAKW
jgi:hypothetical protein